MLLGLPGVEYPDRRRARAAIALAPAGLRPATARALRGVCVQLLLVACYLALSVRGRRSALGVWINILYAANTSAPLSLPLTPSHSLVSRVSPSFCMCPAERSAGNHTPRRRNLTQVNATGPKGPHSSSRD